MDALYSKLYEKYSKLKVTKDTEMDKINQEQEVKFLDFVNGADNLITHLTAENKRLCGNIDELREEVVSLRTANVQQFDKFQERLMEERQRNQQLSAEIEQLRNLLQVGNRNDNRNDSHDDQQANGVQHNPRASGDRFNESSTRTPRKRARLSTANYPAVNSPTGLSRDDLSTGRRSTANRSQRYSSNVHALQPSCCLSNIDDGGGSCKCLFQGLVECLIGMKVSVVDQPEGRCILAFHQSSGYSFSLTWVKKDGPGSEELLYKVTSLGTFANVAPEWMREVIIFSINMCPLFFQRVARVIKPH